MASTLQFGYKSGITHVTVCATRVTVGGCAIPTCMVHKGDQQSYMVHNAGSWCTSQVGGAQHSSVPLKWCHTSVFFQDLSQICSESIFRQTFTFKSMAICFPWLIELFWSFCSTELLTSHHQANQIQAAWIKCFLKDTSYVWGRKQQNQQLLCILASNSANKPSFQNATKRLFAQCSIDVKSAVTF